MGMKSSNRVTQSLCYSFAIFASLAILLAAIGIALFSFQRCPQSGTLTDCWANSAIIILSLLPYVAYLAVPSCLALLLFRMKKRRFFIYYFITNYVIFWLAWCVIITVDRGLTYFLTYPAASDMLAPPKFFLPYDSITHVIRYYLAWGTCLALGLAVLLTIDLFIITKVRAALCKKRADKR